MLVFVILCFCLILKRGAYGIEVYDMQTMCGKKLNMKWKDTYTAEISANSELVSQPTNISDTEPNTVPETTAVRAVYVTSELALCSMVIESWDFQDRIMFYFKDVQFVAKCSEAMLEVFDGPSSKYSLVSGLERPVCNERKRRLLGKIFKTSDKYLTLRLRGHPEALRNVTFRMIIVSFHDGICRSYEHQCTSGVCIMEELVCNGHNPCGDRSDCPTSPTEVAAEESHVITAAIITACLLCAGVFIGLILFWRCYRRRVKLRRQILHQLSNQRTDNNNINEEERGDTNENTIENEAVVQLYSPPSYNSLKETCMGQEDLTKCLEELKNSTLPPSYSCVMSHQDVFHLSYTDLRKLKQAANNKVALSETDVHLLGS